MFCVFCCYRAQGFTCVAEAVGADHKTTEKIVQTTPDVTP